MMHHEESGARQKTQNAPSPAPAAGGSRRVLLADDDAQVRRGLSRVLEQAGYEVVAVGDGTAAIEAVVTGQFDVILTDVHMPGTTGLDLLRVVRAYDLDVPVILMSGDPELETAMEAVELGALQYVRKPVQTTALTAIVERASRLHQMAQLKRQAMAALGAPQADVPGDRAGLMGALDRALEGLRMAFQPIVSVRGRRVVGYEALMRSSEPAFPHPGAVLSAAEGLNRIPDVGRRVRELVAAAIVDAPPDALIFVNLHPSDLLDPSLADATAPLAQYAHRVVLEITERASLGAVDDVQARVSILRYMGYKIAIDDLGAGYAGLTSFAQLEPEFVKLDRTLVSEIHRAPLRQRLVSALGGVCEEMRMTVIAEGVELVEERQHLAALGVDLMQGYFFARPTFGFAKPNFG
jgi:EAL domain-containing protein (putative c-di-GMP-specific phosphodiesterase class I)